MSSLMKVESKLDSLGFTYNVFEALKSSLYPGALDESVMMVLEYCKANEIDPLQKAVHIVPMKVKNKKTGGEEYQDVIMPGIGLYRIQAAKSGLYSGIKEPEFGPTIQANIGGQDVTYPEWCKVTVMKLVNGHMAEFSAKEYWVENYATKGYDKFKKLYDNRPNAMWFKRPFGQLAKCTEAQALRKAFPGIVSQEPTFEEMDGKTNIKDLNEAPKAAKVLKLQKIEEREVNVSEVIDKQTGEILKPIDELKSLIKEHDLESKTVGWLKYFSVATLEEIPDEGIEDIIHKVKKNLPSKE